MWVCLLCPRKGWDRVRDTLGVGALGETTGSGNALQDNPSLSSLTLKCAHLVIEINPAAQLAGRGDLVRRVETVHRGMRRASAKAEVQSWVLVWAGPGAQAGLSGQIKQKENCMGEVLAGAGLT